MVLYPSSNEKVIVRGTKNRLQTAVFYLSLYCKRQVVKGKIATKGKLICTDKDYSGQFRSRDFRRAHERYRHSKGQFVS